MVLPPKVLAAVRFNKPAAPLVSVVVAPLMRPTVPKVMGFKVTDWVASMLSTVMLVALALTLVKPVRPPPTAPARLMSPVPAFTVKALAAVDDVSDPVTTMLLPPPDKVLLKVKALPASCITTLAPKVCVPLEVT